MTGYVIGVDGGQTSTKACLADLDGHVIAHATGAPWDLLVTDEVRSRCRATLAGFVDAFGASVPLDQIRHVALGLTGGFVGADLVRGWIGELLPAAGATVVEDQVGNFRGGDPFGRPGVVVIAGGGSIAWGIDAAGNTTFAGGTGYLLDDEGSGYEIGRQAVVAALKGHQGRTPPTVLTDRLVAHADASDPWDLRIACYDGRLGRPELAALTPLVATAALDGDEAAQAILARAGHDLADMAAAVIRGLSLPSARVYPTGGVFQVPAVRAAFERELASMAPGASALDPLLPPLGGAIAIALDATGSLTESSVSALVQSFAPSAG